MEAKLFTVDVPEHTTPEWYAERESAPHLEQGAHRGRLELAAQYVQVAHEFWDVESLVDLGCGDGGLLQLLLQAPWNGFGNNVKAWGYDLQQTNVDAAKANRPSGVDVRFGNVLDDPIEWGQMANMTEMLEHLIDPHGFLKFVAEHCDTIVCSSPFTETAESHYAFHTWAWDRDGYHALIEGAGFRVVESDTWSMFQVVLATK